MTDPEFLRALENCELPETEFAHAAHVRAAYLYLQEYDFAEALKRIRGTIRNYVRHLGKPDRYHETITVAYLAIIQQHLCERGDAGGWPGFARENAELLQPDLLQRFYTRAQLDSAMARRIFVLPARAGATT